MKKHSVRSIPPHCLLKLLQEKALWLLLLIIAFFFIRPLLLGESFFVRDIYKLFLPQKRLLQEFWALGEWPLWDRYLHGGHPYLGAIGNAAVYPFNLLYLFFPLITAFNLSVILHFFLCAASAYLFARVLGFSSIPAMVVGIAYTFCGLTLSQVNLLHTFFSSAYLPLLFLCWHLFLKEKKQRWFALAVVISVLRLLLGASEQYVIGALLLAGWTLCYPYPLFRARSKVVLWGLLNLFAFGISAIQIVPMLEILSQSSRGEGLSYRMFTFWSLPLQRFPEFIFPQFSGYVDRLSASDYWARSIDDDTPMTLILSVYWGCSLVFLALSAGLNARHETTLPRKTRRFLLLIIGLSTFLAIGRSLPFFELLFQYVPFIKIFRFPIKFLWFSIFPMAVLAGDTVEYHWGRIGRKHDWRPSHSLLIGLWSGVAFLGLLTALWAYSPAWSEGFHQFFFKHSGSEVSQQGLFQAFLHALGVWTLLTLLYQHRSRTKTRWQPALLCGILLLDLLVAGRSLNPTVEKEFYTTTPSVAELVRQHLHNGRLYRTDVPRNPVLQAPENRIIWGARWNLDVLEEFSAAFYGIPVIFHPDFDSLANSRIMTLRALLKHLPWSQKVPFLSAAGVTTILSDERISDPGLRYIAPVPNLSNLEFYLYQNPGALEQAQFVTSWEYADSDESATQAMLRDDFDPKRHVVLQRETLPSIFPWLSKEKEMESDRDVSEHPLPKNADSCSPTEIQNLQSSSSSIAFSLQAPCDAYVVLPHPFYPGWKATIDGNPLAIRRANFAFLAVFAPEGEHHINLSYAPLSVPFGAGISFVFIGLLAAGAVAGIFRRIG